MFPYHSFMYYILNSLLLTPLFIACAGIEEIHEESIHVIHADKGFYEDGVLWNTLDIPVCWENKEEIGRKGREWYMKNCRMMDWKDKMWNIVNK